jgi:hypothetical protein
MQSFLFCLGACLVGQAVLAQGTPVPKVGGSCPTGTYSTQGVCVPQGDTQVFVTDGGCPQGWVKSARYYCVR